MLRSLASGSAGEGQTLSAGPVTMAICSCVRPAPSSSDSQVALGSMAQQATSPLLSPQAASNASESPARNIRMSCPLFIQKMFAVIASPGNAGSGSLTPR